jgi:hypothetical protein
MRKLLAVSEERGEAMERSKTHINPGPSMILIMNVPPAAVTRRRNDMARRVEDSWGTMRIV